MKNFCIISVQPDDLMFYWQLRTQLHNFRKLKLSQYYRVLLFTPNGRIPNTLFYDLAKEYEEAKFFFYIDKDNEASRMIKSFNYIPILRPWTLKQHFRIYPELKEYACLYLDSDVIFTRKMDIDALLGDDINYLSYTGNVERTHNYLDARYFDSKVKDVISSRLATYQKKDILSELASIMGLDRETVVANADHTGGAQYLLKGVDEKFWADVIDGCMLIKTYLGNVNQRFFESEDKGFQSWCADMWSVLWNLWKRGMVTRCPNMMDFAWATDPISKWKKVYIYHDAGATYREHNGEWLFNKRGSRVAFNGSFTYIDNYTMGDKTPYQDDLSWVSPKYCSYNYVKAIQASNNPPYNP
jgi:hypothetical protein